MGAIVFDLDGTLVDSAPDLHAAVNALLADYHRAPLSLGAVKSFIGNGIPKLVDHVMQTRDFEASRREELLAQFLEIYSNDPATLSVLYPGVETALTELRAREFALGVCTNKDVTIARVVLDRLGLTDFFETVVGGGTIAQRKPDPAPLVHAFDGLSASSYLYVGDSEVDAFTATAANVPFALFTEGYRRSGVEEINHDFAFSAFDQLSEIADAAFV